MSALAYCTILARNYLPKALTLAASVRRHGAGEPLVVFLIDATPETALPDVEGVRWMCPYDLDLTERQIHDLAMFYELVELATAVKPLVLAKLLTEHERAAYLDPDTYLTSPMDELTPALDEGAGIVLTPHYLRPTPPGHHFGEGHLLNVGVFNLGFCAVNRDAAEFLDWWWGHLSTECLYDPIAGLFVDQKWVDIGAVLFHATSLQHPGYNVGVGNLHERPLTRADGEYRIDGAGEQLRLFHFHAFDPHRPEALYTRSDARAENLTIDNAALEALSTEYAAQVLDNDRLLGPQPDYIYRDDTTGRRITRRMRHAYRSAVLGGDESAPSPFVPADAERYEAWRKGAWKLAGRLMASDAAKGLRLALPEEFINLKRRLPGLSRTLRSKYVDSGGMWG